MSEPYIAFFDLDLTITGSISGKELAKAAYRKGLLATFDLVNAIVLSLTSRFNLTDQYKIVDKMVSWVKGIPDEKMDDLCNEVLKRVILPSIYNEAVAEINYHKSKNARVVILSSALKTVCVGIAEKLSIDDVICSELESRNGLLTGLPLGRLCFREEKAVRLAAYCNLAGIDPSKTWYYGDSISDLPALSMVGNPVCINPDSTLKKIALKKNWKILSWKN